MLSRIAESLFWIGRYIERSEGSARMVDVHMQRLLQDPWVDEDAACRQLLGVLGAPLPEIGVHATRELVIDKLVVSTSEPASIAFSVTAARENARRAREIISSEFWESLNMTHARVPAELSLERVHPFFEWVRQRAVLAMGTADLSMRHDEGWHFLKLGQAMEQADMTARLVASRVWSAGEQRQGEGPSWVSLVRSCGGYEAYLRSCRGVISEQAAAEFLVRDRNFAGSILASLDQALACIEALDPGRDNVIPGGAAAEIGRIRSEFVYVNASDLVGTLPIWMQRLQEALERATTAVRERFFPAYVQPSWIGSSTWLV